MPSRDLLEDIGGRLRGRVGFDDEQLTVAAHRRLAEKVPEGVELIPAGGLVERLRAVKDEAEIAAMATAADIATAAYDSLPERGLAGRTEREVAVGAGPLHGGLGRRAARFAPIVAAGAHGALPHAVPRDVEIPRDTLVVIDMGACVDGYCSDCTRTLATGSLPASALRSTSSCGARSTTRSRPRGRGGVQGCRRGGARAHRRRRARGALRARAGPRRGPRRSTRGPGSGKTAEGSLAAGNAVTIEPGVYMPGRVRSANRGPRHRRRRRAEGPHRLPEGTRHARLMLLAAVAAFAGAFVQSATGMGFALVLSPALFAVMDPEEAVTAVLLLGAVLCALILFESRRVGTHGLGPPAPAGAARAGARARRAGGALEGRAPDRCGRRGRRGRRLAASPRSRGPAAERGRGRLRRRGAHHVDQRERAAARAVARIGARAAGGVPRHAGRRVPDPGRRRRRADRVQGGRRCGRSRMARPARGLRSRGLRARCGGLPAPGRRALLGDRVDRSSSARVWRAWLPESSRSLAQTTEVDYGRVRCTDARSSWAQSSVRGSAAPASAATRTVTARTAVARSCFHDVSSSAKGRRMRRAKAPARGLVSVRLRSAGDWDVGVFGRHHRLVAGSASFGGNELASGFVRRGERLVVQACRFRGTCPQPRVSIHFTRIPKTKGRRFSVVDVITPTRADQQRLQALDLDLTEHGDANSVEVAAPRPRRRAHPARGRLPLPRPDRRPRGAGPAQRSPRRAARAAPPRPPACRAGAPPTGTWRTTTSR